ncbi:MAG: nucleotidyltransferase family protein [Actinomycetota bacterium]|nr:nucleotidyltransferase family protein [Actinomycetota bacterium]
MSGSRDGAPLRSVEGADYDERRFLAVMREAVDVLEAHGVPHVLMGGIAVAALGRPRWTHDVDVFLRPDDARRALGVLNDAGFAPEEHDPLWIFKAVKDEVLVDLIFRSQGDIYLDGDMLARAITTTFKGERIRVLPPEDLIVIKAAAHTEDTAYHWFDALAVLTNNELDWRYLLRRAPHSIRRVLSFLVFAESNDAPVPRWAVLDLMDRVYGLRGEPARVPDGSDGTQENGIAVEARERLRRDPRTADVDVEVTTHGDTIMLTGEVATEERRALLDDVAAELFPHRRIDNRTDVRRLEEPVTVEEIS